MQIAKRIQPDATVFTAELYAIYDCISYINESNQDHFVIFSDSRCALLALQKYLNPNPLVQMIQCHIHSSPKEIKLCWVPSHVGVPLNEVADELAKGAVSTQRVTTVNLPRSDHRRVIKYSVTHKWKEKWNNIENNKYREITPHVTPLPYSSVPDRRWSITLTRLRIGHSPLTHGYLMEGSGMPFCEDCIVPLTIKHILVECPNFAELRHRCFHLANINLKDMLDGHHCNIRGPLYEFVRRIPLFHNNI